MQPKPDCVTACGKKTLSIAYAFCPSCYKEWKEKEWPDWLKYLVWAFWTEKNKARRDAKYTESFDFLVQRFGEDWINDNTQLYGGKWGRKRGADVQAIDEVLA